MALDGLGFFAVNLDADRAYVRGGHFFLDDAGVFRDTVGRRLQGTNVDRNGIVTGYERCDDFLRVPPLNPPKATTFVDVRVNLDAQSDVLPGTFDVENPAATSNFATSVTVFDSLSQQHQIDVYFRLIRSGGDWDWYAVTDGSGVGGMPGQPVQKASGQLYFTPTGSLMTSTGTESVWNFTDAAPGQRISWRFGAISAGGDGVGGVTQFSSPNGTTALSQDGYGSGVPMEVRVDRVGVLEVTYSNGQVLTIGTVPVILFAHFSELVRAGTSAYLASQQSGPPLPGKPGLGGRASILPGFLEDPPHP